MDPFIFNSPSFQEFQETMPPLIELLVTKTMRYAGATIFLVYPPCLLPWSFASRLLLNRKQRP